MLNIKEYHNGVSLSLPNNIYIYMISTSKLYSKTSKVYLD